MKDRLSFQRFLGLALSDTVPDEKTIWEFRNKLTEAKVIEKIFYGFTEQLERKGIIIRSGGLKSVA